MTRSRMQGGISSSTKASGTRVSCGNFVGFTGISIGKVRQSRGGLKSLCSEHLTALQTTGVWLH